MSRTESCLEFEFEFDEAPEKVWTAISDDTYRERWLEDQTVVETLNEQPSSELELLIEERQPPFERSVVRFMVIGNGRGGTTFRIAHRPATLLAAANQNCVMALQAA